MIGCRRACASIASTACVAWFSRRGVHAFATLPAAATTTGHSFTFGHQNVIITTRRQRVSGTKLSRPTKTRHASSLLSASATEYDGSESPFPQLYDNTLLSIQQCIEVQTQQKIILSQSRTKTNNRQSPKAKVAFVDGSWYHKPDPATGLRRNPAREYVVGPRLPDARYLDIDAVAATRELFPERNPEKLPHMMPPPKLFALAMDAYDIREDDHIVVYARRGALFTPRVWFLFICMGHDPKKVHLMQGSLEDYAEEGGLVDDASLATEKETYASMGESYADCFDQGILDVDRLHETYYANTTPRYSLDVSSAKHICGKEEVLDQINKHLDNSSNEKDSKKSVILDTRGSGYAKKGYMPSAVHLPYSQIASPDNALMIRPKSELKKLFDDRGIDYLDSELKIIFSCGSGVSVCHGYLALKELGRDITEENTRIYDGSWKEWGKEDGLPKILPERKK